LVRSGPADAFVATGPGPATVEIISVAPEDLDPLVPSSLYASVPLKGSS
jgi:hypothetical protein